MQRACTAPGQKKSKNERMQRACTAPCSLRARGQKKKRRKERAHTHATSLHSAQCHAKSPSRSKNSAPEGVRTMDLLQPRDAERFPLQLRKIAV
jgi:hypothetical protein